MVLDLRPVARQLDTLHQRFVDDGLPKELLPDAFAAANLSGHPPAALARGRAAWQARALELDASVVVAARFISDLTEMGTSTDIRGAAARVLRDKVRHLDVARRVLLALGGDESVPGTPRAPKVLDVSVRARVIATLLERLCIEDAILMRVYATMGKSTEDPQAKAAIDLMAADTAISSQLGWAMLDVVIPALERSEKVGIVQDLPVAYAAVEKRFNPAPLTPTTRSGGPTHPFGSLDPATKARVFADAVYRVTERFERLGLPGKAAWDQRPRGAAE